MILETLLDHPLQGKKVIDMGCGTGILGIATLLLGAYSLIAIDVSSDCITNSLHNLGLNGFAPESKLISVLHGDASLLLQYPSQADLLIANIHRNIILQDLHNYAQAVHLGGEVWLSGFLQSDRQAIYEALGEEKLLLLQEVTSDEWVFIRTRRE